MKNYEEFVDELKNSRAEAEVELLNLGEISPLAWELIKKFMLKSDVLAAVEIAHQTSAMAIKGGKDQSSRLAPSARR